MPEPVHYKFAITSQTIDCTEVPEPEVPDKCRIAVYHDSGSLSFSLIRQGRNFKLSPEDAERIKKTYPNYQPPAEKLKDFLEVTRDFYNQFGDRNAPTSIAGGIRILTQTNVFDINEILINFIAQGNVEPKTSGEKTLQEGAVGNSVAAFADPTMGILLEKTLSRIRENTQLSPGVRERAKWLQRVTEVRKHLWDEIKPKMETSLDLGGKLKASTQKIIMFLFSPQILDDQGARSGLFNDALIEAAQKHHDILSQIDPHYSVDQNYYHYMATVLRTIKQRIRISDDTVKGYDKRINMAIGMMESEAKKETLRLLPYEDNLRAFKISLIQKYGDTPEREMAVKLLVDPITVKVQGNNPTYVVPMATIDRGLRDWVQRQSTAEKERLATEAILYVIDHFLERGEKIEAYWNGDYRQVDSFFSADNFGKSILGGNNNKVLQNLIVWARSEADVKQINLFPGQDPQPALRKWTLLGELGVGAAGLGTFFIPYKDPEARYYGRGTSIILGSSALGAAAGNALSYQFKAGKNAWLYDVGGAIIGGLAGGLIYGFTTTKPDMGGPGDNGPSNPPPPRDPGDRVEKIPFGP